MSRFGEALHSGRVLLMDGAMGTELQRRGIAEGACYEAWNLTHPDQVRAIHQSYRDAGAECLLTNTFQANMLILTRHGQQGQWMAIPRAGYDLARDVAGPDGFVIGAIGPIPQTDADLPAEQCLDLAIGNSNQADAILLETISDDRMPLQLVPIRRSHCMPIFLGPMLLSFAFRRCPATGRLLTEDGNTPEHHAAKAREHYGVDALGVNCGRDIGMDDIIDIIHRYRRETDLPLFARPNAGTPARIGGRWVYPLMPNTMAARLPELLDAGVTMVGGCCGTTPAHIAAMRPIIDAWNARRPARGASS